jgi:hypothetical protein
MAKLSNLSSMKTGEGANTLGVGLEMLRCDFHKKTVAQFWQAPALAANGESGGRKYPPTVLIAMYRRILELLWHWNVEPLLSAWHEMCKSISCGPLRSALNSPQTLPPKGMIELDSVVRTRPYESALPAVFLQLPIDKVSWLPMSVADLDV